MSETQGFLIATRGRKALLEDPRWYFQCQRGPELRARAGGGCRARADRPLPQGGGSQGRVRGPAAAEATAMEGALTERQVSGLRGAGSQAPALPGRFPVNGCLNVSDYDN